MGIYNVVTLCYTAIQVTIDSVPRFAVIRCLLNPAARGFMNRYHRHARAGVHDLVGLMLFLRSNGTLETWGESSRRSRCVRSGFAPGPLYVGHPAGHQPVGEPA
ncbi:hypothetical protein QJS66_11485 [Kocuria rhizophila]|nr:hypothetical protein QJS66_11485 [Kocuria rhizophila]